MHIQFICPNCQATLRIAEEHAGKSGKCPQCKHSLTVPVPCSVVSPASLPAESGIPAKPSAPLIEQSPPGPEFQKCPECAEEIRFAATKCQHCGALLPENAASTQPSPPPVGPERQCISPKSPATSPGEKLPSDPNEIVKRVFRRVVSWDLPWWLFILGFIALIVGPSYVSIPLILGLIILLLCVSAFIPHVQRISRWVLRLKPGERCEMWGETRETWRDLLLLPTCCLLGLVLLFAAYCISEANDMQKTIAWEKTNKDRENERLANEANAHVVVLVSEAQTSLVNGEYSISMAKLVTAEKTEHATDLSAIQPMRQRVKAEANARVKSLVSEAEAALKAGDHALAKEKLASAEKTEVATDLSPVRSFRPQAANAEVDALRLRAEEALRADNVDVAKDYIQAALSVPYASQFDAVKDLQKKIANSTNREWTRAVLLEVSNDDFALLRDKGSAPSDLLSGYEGLDKITTACAREMIVEVAAARELRREEQAEKEQRAALAELGAVTQRQEAERQQAEAAARQAAYAQYPGVRSALSCPVRRRRPYRQRKYSRDQQEEIFKQRFKGRTYCVRGVITDVGKDFGGRKYITVEVADMHYFDIYPADDFNILAYQKGSTVTFTGTWTYFGTGIMVKHKSRARMNCGDRRVWRLLAPDFQPVCLYGCIGPVATAEWFRQNIFIGSPARC